MRDTLLRLSDRVIRYGFYLLFFLIPLAVTNSTSELYELNKMWLTWEITLFIGAAWITKMMLTNRFRITRTPLDIPLLLFLLSQIIATVVSLDTHTSFWGYYSRFNGGLLSTITYIFLYYAAVSNLTKPQVMTALKASLASGIIVALWGLPSHFGKDPTCLLFRGSLDVNCWTDAFKPTVRIFSTLGQPAWMSAYVNILMPLTIACSLLVVPTVSAFLKRTPHQKTPTMTSLFTSWKFISLVVLFTMFFFCLLFTGTRAGVIAFWTAFVFFWFFVGIKRFVPFTMFIRLLSFFSGIIIVIHFFLGTSFTQLDQFTYKALTSQRTVENQVVSPEAPQVSPTGTGSIGGTDSGKIRQIVWQGAIDVWKAYPIFGSGTETFAFSYYKYRPADHNLTSEWDYLYNKAHNEYLNYLATTGIVGLGTYLLFIGGYLLLLLRFLLKTKDVTGELLIGIALAAGFLSILITNFFGFSVVIVNLYLFLIPAFTFLLLPKLTPRKELAFPKQEKTHTSQNISAWHWVGISTIALLALFFLLMLLRFWYADKAYALGSNYSNVQEYQSAYLKLGEAIDLRPSEPVFKDEFAVNNAMIAALLLLQDNPATPSAQAQEQAQLLSGQAIGISDELTQNHPNNISFWKNRVRIFYTLAQVDPRYLPFALEAVKHVRELAPTDAKVTYNLGALYQENGMPKEASETLEDAILLKPDYRDAYLALALAYNSLAVDEAGTVIDPEMREKAIRQLRFILDRINPNDSQAKQTLEEWTKP